MDSLEPEGRGWTDRADTPWRPEQEELQVLSHTVLGHGIQQAEGQKAEWGSSSAGFGKGRGWPKLQEGWSREGPKSG